MSATEFVSSKCQICRGRGWNFYTDDQKTMYRVLCVCRELPAIEIHDDTPPAPLRLIVPLHVSPPAAPAAQGQPPSMADHKITREWFEKRAAAERDHEIGAGLPTYVPPFIPSDADKYYGRIISSLMARIAELEDQAEEVSDRAWEKAATLIENHGVQNTNDGKRLVPRIDGDLEGITYAAAIRAMKGDKP